MMPQPDPIDEALLSTGDDDARGKIEAAITVFTRSRPRIVTGQAWRPLAAALIAETAADHDVLEPRDPRLGVSHGNFMRALAVPEDVEYWSLTTFREKLVKLSRHGHGSNTCAITVLAGLTLDEHVEPSVVPGPRRWFAVARTGNAEVKLVAGSNVAIHHPAQAGGELVIPQWSTAICFYTRIDTTSSRLSVTGF